MNNAKSNKWKFISMKPREAMTAINISVDFICRTSADFSYLSATSPASEENRKKGKTNIAPVVTTRTLLLLESPWYMLRSKNMIIEKRSKLSLSAPKN